MLPHPANYKRPRDDDASSVASSRLTVPANQKGGPDRSRRKQRAESESASVRGGAPDRGGGESSRDKRAAADSFADILGCVTDSLGDFVDIGNPAETPEQKLGDDFERVFGDVMYNVFLTAFLRPDSASLMFIEYANTWLMQCNLRCGRLLSRLFYHDMCTYTAMAVSNSKEKSRAVLSELEGLVGKTEWAFDQFVRHNNGLEDVLVRAEQYFYDAEEFRSVLGDEGAGAGEDEASAAGSARAAEANPHPAAGPTGVVALEPGGYNRYLQNTFHPLGGAAHSPVPPPGIVRLDMPKAAAAASGSAADLDEHIFMNAYAAECAKRNAEAHNGPAELSYGILRRMEETQGRACLLFPEITGMRPASKPTAEVDRTKALQKWKLLGYPESLVKEIERISEMRSTYRAIHDYLEKTQLASSVVLARMNTFSDLYHKIAVVVAKERGRREHLSNILIQSICRKPVPHNNKDGGAAALLSVLSDINADVFRAAREISAVSGAIPFVHKDDAGGPVHAKVSASKKLEYEKAARERAANPEKVGVPMPRTFAAEGAGSVEKRGMAEKMHFTNAMLPQSAPGGVYASHKVGDDKRVRACLSRFIVDFLEGRVGGHVRAAARDDGSDAESEGNCAGAVRAATEADGDARDELAAPFSFSRSYEMFQATGTSITTLSDNMTALCDAPGSGRIAEDKLAGWVKTIISAHAGIAEKITIDLAWMVLTENFVVDRYVRASKTNLYDPSTQNGAASTEAVRTYVSTMWSAKKFGTIRSRIDEIQTIMRHSIERCSQHNAVLAMIISYIESDQLYELRVIPSQRSLVESRYSCPITRIIYNPSNSTTAGMPVLLLVVLKSSSPSLSTPALTVNCDITVFWYLQSIILLKNIGGHIDNLVCARFAEYCAAEGGAGASRPARPAASVHSRARESTVMSAGHQLVSGKLPAKRHGQSDGAGGSSLEAAVDRAAMFRFFMNARNADAYNMLSLAVKSVNERIESVHNFGEMVYKQNTMRR